MLGLIITLGLIVGILIVGILYLIITLIVPPKEKDDEIIDNYNYITPKKMDIGYLPLPQKLANLCSNDMYPIQGLSPKYGNDFNYCKSCTQFIQPP